MSSPAPGSTGIAPTGSSPDEFKQTLERVSQLAVDYLRELPHRAVYRPLPDELIRRLGRAPLPEHGDSTDRILEDLERDVLPYAMGIGHPRSWGGLGASAIPLGAAADLLASTINNTGVGSAQIATHLEMIVIRWLSELVGFGGHATGILTSGRSAANFVALAAMRETKLPGARQAGLLGRDDRPVIYASSEAHSSIQRAVEYLGFGSRALRIVPVDEEFRMRASALESMITEDRVRGRSPICVVATAGTVTCGVIDPLLPLVEIAQREELWLHVDGAYGAVGAALPELTPLYRGIADADSLVLDPQSWLYVPQEVGAVIVHDSDTLRAAFATPAEYLQVPEDDSYVGPLWYHEYGPQLSRELRALKVWAVLRHLGLAGLRELWRRDLSSARTLERLISDHDKLEMLTPPELTICCFRYRPRIGDPNEFNRMLLDRIRQDGRTFLSGATLSGVFALRACIVNFRTTVEDLRMAVEAVTELGAALERELTAA